MKKIASLLFVGAIIFGSANAQVLSEQNVTINMDLQPVLQLSIEGPEQIDFNFTEIDQYYAGIIKNGANVLKVSSSVSFDLWAAGLSQGNVSSLCMDQLIDYQGGGTAGLNTIPVTALELHQFPPNPLVTANTATCDGTTAMDDKSDYSQAFATIDATTNAPAAGAGNNAIYAPAATTPYIAPQMTGVLTAEEKYIAGGDGTSSCSVVGGSYLTNTMGFNAPNPTAPPPTIAGSGLPSTAGYYFVMDYRIVPGLPAMFPMHVATNNANSTAATLTDAATAAGALATAGNYAAPGVYSMSVKYILAEDQ